MSKGEKIGLGIIIAIIVLVIFAAGMDCGRHTISTEAVRAGAARWIPKSERSNTLEWITPTSQPTQESK
jgi:hypothetical protein